MILIIGCCFDLCKVKFRPFLLSFIYLGQTQQSSEFSLVSMMRAHIWLCSGDHLWYQGLNHSKSLKALCLHYFPPSNSDHWVCARMFLLVAILHGRWAEVWEIGLVPVGSTDHLAPEFISPDDKPISRGPCHTAWPPGLTLLVIISHGTNHQWLFKMKIWSWCIVKAPLIVI